MGVTGSAFDSYLLRLRTLSPRMKWRSEMPAIVEYLKTQPLVKKLYHRRRKPGMKLRRVSKGFGAMLLRA